MTGTMKRFLDSAGVTRLIQAVAILSLILAIGIGFKQYSLASCLSEYSDANAKASSERLIAAEQDRKAQDTLFQAIANDPASAVPALQAYNTARAESDKKRRENPPPEPPSLRCA